MSHNYVKITDPTFLLVCFMELLPGPTSQQFPSCPGIKSNNSNHFGMDKPNEKDTQENVWTATKASCQLFIDKRFNAIRNNVIRVGSKEEEEKKPQIYKRSNLRLSCGRFAICSTFFPTDSPKGPDVHRGYQYRGYRGYGIFFTLFYSYIFHCQPNFNQL